MARHSIEVMLEKKVGQLREAEKLKKEELAQITRDLGKYETALGSLNGNVLAMPKKRRTKNEFQNKQAESQE